MYARIAKTVGAVGALGALALGGSALADAPSITNTTSSGAQTQTARPRRASAPTTPPRVPGGTVLRVETDVDHGSPYEAHVRKSEGSEVEVLVNKTFTVTAVNTMGGPGGLQHP